jgi:MerR family transcriptional regulator, light-induced transcriptional regulator
VSHADSDSTIAAVERDTGIGKDTLRMWERRYGFPAPVRNPYGERTYPSAQVAKLRVVKRLLDAGFRPGRIVPMPIDELLRLGGQQGEPPPARSIAEVASKQPVQECLALVRASEMAGLRHQFELAQVHMGLSRFVTELIAPLNTLIGEAWMRGEIEVFQEHAYAEVVQRTLGHVLHGLPTAGPESRPRVLLTTLRDEPHGLGLLMAELVLAIDGARCTSLGVQTPLPEVLRSSEAFETDIVGLSFTGCNGPNAALNGLAELRSQLPQRVEIWAGGTVGAFSRRVGEGVRVVAELSLIRAELKRWRATTLSRPAV